MNFSDLRFCRFSLGDLRGGAPVQFTWQEPASKPVLEPDEVHLWLTNLDRANWQSDVLQHVLNESERLRARKFHFDADRNRFIARRAILRQILGQYLGKNPAEIEFIQNSFGKPALASNVGASMLQFNLSASSDWTLAVFAMGRRLGVDIEKVREEMSWAEIAGRFFHPREVTSINELPETNRPTAFFKHWTMKEAFIKACGVGLNRSLLEIDFTPILRETTRSYLDVDGTNWFCISFKPDDRLMAALVVES